MSYVKAVDVLPEELLDLIQNYIDGKYIYIPRKECNRKDWGETTQSKKELADRNVTIYMRYKAGTSVNILSEMFYLSPKSIQRIISKMRKEDL
ncbi:MAG: CD3324 family protein [Bacillota bacterium]